MTINYYNETILNERQDVVESINAAISTAFSNAFKNKSELYECKKCKRQPSFPIKFGTSKTHYLCYLCMGQYLDVLILNMAIIVRLISDVLMLFLPEEDQILNDINRR